MSTTASFLPLDSRPRPEKLTVPERTERVEARDLQIRALGSCRFESPIAARLGPAALHRVGRAERVLLDDRWSTLKGATAQESYAATLEAINRAAAFVGERTASSEPFGGRLVEPVPEEQRAPLLAEVLPALRGAVSGDGRRILQVDVSENAVEFACGAQSPELGAQDAHVLAHAHPHSVHVLRRHGRHRPRRHRRRRQRGEVGRRDADEDVAEAGLAHELSADAP